LALKVGNKGLEDCGENVYYTVLGYLFGGFYYFDNVAFVWLETAVAAFCKEFCVFCYDEVYCGLKGGLARLGDL
jgi:hypothetical protein